ncbi:MAG: CDP-alcohol phosphatidyltransferase family protein, partial [Candidatus Firestonebacteria bacterium]
MMKKYNAEKIPLLPTLLTTGNLVCGFMAFIFAVNDAFRLIDVNGNQGTHLVPYLNSCYLILLAMVFDMFDGIVARLTKTD